MTSTAPRDTVSVDGCDCQDAEHTAPQRMCAHRLAWRPRRGTPQAFAVGYIRGGIYSYGSRKSRIAADAQSNQVFAWLWPRVTQSSLPPCIEIWHGGACGRCGRTLTDPLSIETGIGPVRRGKMADELEGVER